MLEHGRRNSEGLQPQPLRGIFWVGGALLVFLLLAASVQVGATQALDDGILKSIRSLALKHSTPMQLWGEESIVAITSLGALVVLIGLTCSVVILLLMLGRRRESWLLLAVLLGAIGLNYGLKALFGRSRPTVVAHIQRVDTASFPSGHALISTAVYAGLGLTVARFLAERRLKIYILWLSALLAFFIGLSRVYLGVHYPTDVAGGWLVGFAWSGICWRTASFLRRRAEGRVSKGYNRTAG